MRDALRLPRRDWRRDLMTDLGDGTYWVGWGLGVWFLGAEWSRDWSTFGALVFAATGLSWMFWSGLIVKEHSPLQVVGIVFGSLVTVWVLLWRFALS